MEMPHSTACCLSAFEIGVSESRRGKEGGTGLFPCRTVPLALRGAALTPCALLLQVQLCFLTC